jgi:hypothetical protein
MREIWSSGRYTVRHEVVRNVRRWWNGMRKDAQKTKSKVIKVL